MKNTVKFLSMMFAVSAMMLVSCTDEPDTPDTPVEPTKYTVLVNSNDATMGTATITPQQQVYVEGDTVVITATPNDGYKFLNWNGSITDNPYTYVVKDNITFTANFEALPRPTWSASFNGSPIDIAHWSDGQCASDGSVWLFQAAQHGEPNGQGGVSVNFPFVVLWLTGQSPNALTVHSNTELYMETYYQVGSEQWGDWQFKSMESMNCTELDLTAYKMSMTTSVILYSLTEVADGTAEDAAHASTSTLGVTLGNYIFTPQSQKAELKKMSL